MLNNISTPETTKNHLSSVINDKNPDRVSQVEERHKSLTAFIPSNLDLEKLLINNPPAFKYKRDEFVYLLDLIYKLHNKNSDEYYSRPLSALMQLRTKNYRRCLTYLVNNGVLVESPQYLANQFARGFAYSYHYAVSEIKEVKITDKFLIRKILKFYNVDGTEPVIDDSALDITYLTKWYDEGRLKIDFKSAKKYLRDLYLSDRLTLIETKEYKKLSQQADFNFKRYQKYVAMQKYNARLRTLKLFHKGTFNVGLDRTAGRLHSVITQLKSELRQFMTYDSQPLTSIDIVNSQPYLASVLLNYESYKKNNINDLIQLYNPKFHPSHKNPIMLAKLIQKVENADNVLKFIDAVKNGRFYEEFGILLNIDTSIDENRKFVKDIVFTALFSPNEKEKHLKEIKLFKTAYPDVFKIFKLVKSVKGKHRALACTLQRFEASLILHSACKKISEINPDVPLLTIHDSIVTIPQYQDLVEQVMKEILEKAVGFAPQLKIEKWERVA